MLRLIALLVALLCPALGAAAPLPRDHCAIVLASRADMAGVAAWIAANAAYAVDGLYRASNGYLTISGGVIAVQGWREEVGRRKAAGRAPADAFCSGRGLAAEVWSRASGRPPPWDGPAGTPSGEAGGLFTPFDARGLGTAEKRVLQAALAVEGMSMRPSRRSGTEPASRSR